MYWKGIAYMRLWLATSRSARKFLANVRCAEARRFGWGAFCKLGTEHGVLKQLYSRNYSPPRAIAPPWPLFQRMILSA
ncbi:hypothetical protein TNCT_687141 [Trichonephila clavata]|uniref:Uncharacterized protein n=1 Tax=Trichonephila clavata TaxID=2740835 RepID=A0A8X6HM30_TRICU|nr:hypothetical protein TNCT_687141 [Trichonephila clavata]